MDSSLAVQIVRRGLFSIVSFCVGSGRTGISALLCRFPSTSCRFTATLGWASQKFGNVDLTFFIDDLILTYFEASSFGSGGFLGVSRFPRRDVVLLLSFVIGDVFGFSISREQSQNCFGSEG